MKQLSCDILDEWISACTEFVLDEQNLSGRIDALSAQQVPGSFRGRLIRVISRHRTCFIHLVFFPDYQPVQRSLPTMDSCGLKGNWLFLATAGDNPSRGYHFKSFHINSNCLLSVQIIWFCFISVHFVSYQFTSSHISSNRFISVQIIINS